MFLKSGKIFGVLCVETAHLQSEGHMPEDNEAYVSGYFGLFWLVMCSICLHLPVARPVEGRASQARTASFFARV